MEPHAFFDAMLSMRGMNPNSLSRAIKRPGAQSGFDRFRKGLIKQPMRTDTWEKAARVLGVHPLSFHDAEMADREWRRLNALGASPIPPGGDELALVQFKLHGPYPLISSVQAGNWTERCDNLGNIEEWGPASKNLGPRGYLLRVEGNSMTNPYDRKSFPPGVILQVNPDLDALPGKFVIVRRSDSNETTFKKLISIDGELYLEAINPEWPKEKKYLKLQEGDVFCGVVVDASLGGV